MTGILWPQLTLPPSSFGYSMSYSDTSGGQAAGGGQQFVVSPGPRWFASMTLHINSRSKVLRVRSLRASLHGRGVPVQLPNFDLMRVPWPVDPLYGVLYPERVRDASLDGTAYQQLKIPLESQIIAVAAADAPNRATTIAIDMQQGGLIEAGHQFGYDERLYEIATVVSRVGSVTTVNFAPPLRQAVIAGNPIRFTTAICLMRCMNLDDQLRILEGQRFATLSLAFEEYL